MRKTINIGGQDMLLKVSARTLFDYNAEFGRDLEKDFDTLMVGFNESVKNNSKIPWTAIMIAARMTYIMAKSADPSMTSSFNEWLGELDSFPVECIPEIVTLWVGSIQPSVNPKNV